MKARPAGITFLSVLYFIGAIINTALLVLSVAARSRVVALLERVTPAGTMGPAALLRLGAALPFYFLLVAVLTFFLGRGLWKLENWARIFTMVLVTISLVGVVLQLAMGARLHLMPIVFLSVFRMAVILLILWYLNQRRVREAFTAAPSSTATR